LHADRIRTGLSLIFVEDVFAVQTPNPGPRKDRRKLSLAKAPSRKATEVVIASKPARSDVLPFKQAMDILTAAVSAEQVVIITTADVKIPFYATPAPAPEFVLKD